MQSAHLAVLSQRARNAVVHRREALPWVLIGAAVVALAVGDVATLTGSGLSADPGAGRFLPSAVLATVALGGVAGEVLLGVGAFVVLRRRGHRMDRSGWLDSALAACGAAAVGLAAADVRARGGFDPGLYQAAHLVVGLTIGLVLLQVVLLGGWRDQVIVWLALGLIARQAGSVGGLVDGGGPWWILDPRLMWLAFTACLATAAWHERRPGTWRATGALPGLAPGGWVIPTLCMVGAVGVLVWGQSRPLPLPAAALATVTLAFTIVRAATRGRQQERLGELAAVTRTDELSGLLNRRGFTAELARAVAAGPGALLVVDVDRFRDVNELFGHEAADDVLAQLGARLRRFAHGGEVLGRLGADEFALATNAPSGPAAMAAARRVRSLVEVPFDVRGDVLRVEVTVGVSNWMDDTAEVDVLLGQAMAAVTHARQRGLPAERWDADRDVLAVRRLALADSLRRSVRRDELSLHYQPKVNLVTGEVVGVEALARWENDGQPVAPDTFIALAEEGGLIGDLTRSLLAKALAQQRVWWEQGHDLVMAVNLSPRNLVDPSLPRRVATLLDQHRVPADRLLLEITETTLMPDPRRSGLVLERLRHHGVRVSIDDYGTGHAALGYLRDFSVDELKLDRSYVAAMISDPRTAAIVRSTVEMGRELGLVVVAEGVEDEAQAEALVACGCTVAQGYLLCRPVPPGELTTWLEARRA